MRKFLLIGLLWCFPLLLTAQEDVEHENILKVKVGTGYLLDTYLSPLGYTGLQFGLGNEWWQSFSKNSKLGQAGKLDHWSHTGRIDASLADYINGARSNQILGVQVTAGWGAFYEWRWIGERLRVWVGPYLETDLGVKYHASNVNKIVSLDVAIDVMAMGGISWSFYGKKTSYRLSYLLRTNLIGFDYLPEYWESYYEITEGIPGQARCSGHWNHNTLKHQLSLDMQFPHTTWRVGAEHELVNYGTADLHFMRHQLNFVVGCLWRYRTRSNARL